MLQVKSGGGGEGGSDENLRKLRDSFHVECRTKTVEIGAVENQTDNQCWLLKPRLR